MPEGEQPTPVTAGTPPATPAAPASLAPPAIPVALPGATWKELQEFINKQNERDRDLIDKWFKLACTIIGGVFAVAAIVIGIVGWKTISDAKASADEAA